VYPLDFKDHVVTLTGIDDTTTIWDELRDSTLTSDLVITVRSQNFAIDAKYITFNLNNVAWKSVSTSGLILEGDAIASSKGDYHVFTVQGQPQTIDVSFADVATGVFATHYPA
jgi:hypothetical protein